MKKKKLRIALVFGGTSEEREVSLHTAKNVSATLVKKYDVLPIEVSKQGKWLINSDTIKQITKQSGAKALSSNREIVPIDNNSQAKVDLAFLALHGPGGEDGTIQGMLELLKVKYTGSGVLASALAMDKAKTKRLVASEGVKVASHIILSKKDFYKNPNRYLSKLKGKLVIKPNRIGSSIGVSISSKKIQIKQGIEKAFEHDDEVMIEQFLAGREFTVPVVGNKKFQALPVIEIIPKGGSDFFDFLAKYNSKFSDEIVPAQISKNLTLDLQSRAVIIHKLLGCSGVTRTDFIVTANGEIYFLEINTLPGMTDNSLVPKSAAAAGISFPKLLDKLIALALDKE